MHRRKLILLIGLPIYTFALMLVGSVLLFLIVVEDPGEWANMPGAIIEEMGDEEWWFYAGMSAIVIVALQAVFLIPVFSRRPPRERRGKSLTVSLLMAGVFAGGLMFALGAGAMELIRMATGRKVGNEDALWLLPGGALAAGWVFWSLLLVLYVRGIWADRTLGRIVGVLFAGTVLETLIILPIDIMVRRRTDCYCSTGTFFALTLSALGVLWLAGPGIVIALMSGKHRRWRDVYCTNCGYAKGPSPGPRCAECGCVWEKGSAGPAREAITGESDAARPTAEKRSVA